MEENEPESTTLHGTWIKSTPGAAPLPGWAVSPAKTDSLLELPGELFVDPEDVTAVFPVPGSSNRDTWVLMYSGDRLLVEGMRAREVRRLVEEAR